MIDSVPLGKGARVVDLLKYGFFFGLGLSVAAWSAYGLAWALWPKDCCSSRKSATEFPAGTISESATNTPEISDVEEHKVGAQLYFTGVVKNSGAKPINSSQIEVNLFKSGKFVDQYSNYVLGAIAPGESRYFKVGCDCRESPHADYDTFRARAIVTY